MIKKIDANEYGVVRYAITSVDELNRLPKEIAPSSQAILIENGLRVFVYGDRQWVEEVVDGDLSENMRSIVADYERSKIGYDGVKRGSLGERLKDDFQGIYDILNARDYCEYSGKELKVDNTWMGNQIDTRVEGRTLQNLIPSEWIIGGNLSGHATYNVDTKVISAICDGSYSHARFYGDDFLKLIKAGSTYTICFKTRRVGSSVNREISLGYYDSNGSTRYMDYLVFTINEGVTQHIYSFRVYNSYENTNGTQLRFTLSSISDGSLDVYDIVLLEGDYTQTSLSELPYFEGIESVGDKSKNLFKITDNYEIDRFGLHIKFDKDKQNITLNGTRTDNDNYYYMTEYPWEVRNNKTGIHIIKIHELSGSYNFTSNTSGSYFAIGIRDKNDETKTYLTLSSIDKSNTGDVLSDVGGRSWFRINRGVQFNNFTFSIQFEEGTQATAYEPYYDGYKISGKSCGKNLFDVNLCPTPPNNGLNFNKDNGELFVTGNSTAIYDIYLVNNNDITLKLKKYINSLPIGTILTLSNNLGLPNYFGYKDESGKISYVANKYTTKLNEEVAFCFVRIAEGQNFDNTQIKIQLEESTTTTPYEPYQESTYSIHSPIPLRSLPNGVCDVYDFESGAVIQRVGKVVLDGSENWSTSTMSSDGFKRYYLELFPHQVRRDGTKSMCSINDKVFNRITEHHGGYEYLFVQSSYEVMCVYYQVLESKAGSVADFKLWLQANPTTVYYELEEPIIHYLTPSQLKSFDGTTHVISENTLIPTTTTKILTSTYANVSNVNSTAYSLRRGVNDVAETSAIINETDVEQDDVLDITMCAIDELYSMLEPNLE